MKSWMTMGLSCLLLGILWATSVSAQAKQLDGHWEGAISQPAGELKIMAEFTTEGDAAKGSFSLPAAAVFQWPLTIVHTSSNVKFRLPNGTLFDGELQGETISGKVPSPTGGYVDPF